ncbi:unnamed protein product [Calicophoron daubneyi]|uniref:Uncharacterized protein n=1 Tax=Calicophoron daubneyi TaxID=300641 RepID=A0AAV2TC53_CALDB
MSPEAGQTLSGGVFSVRTCVATGGEQVCTEDKVMFGSTEDISKPAELSQSLKATESVSSTHAVFKLQSAGSQGQSSAPCRSASQHSMVPVRQLLPQSSQESCSKQMSIPLISPCHLSDIDGTKSPRKILGMNIAPESANQLSSAGICREHGKVCDMSDVDGTKSARETILSVYSCASARREFGSGPERKSTSASRLMSQEAGETPSGGVFSVRTCVATGGEQVCTEDKVMFGSTEDISKPVDGTKPACETTLSVCSCASAIKEFAPGVEGQCTSVSRVPSQEDSRCLYNLQEADGKISPGGVLTVKTCLTTDGEPVCTEEKVVFNSAEDVGKPVEFSYDLKATDSVPSAHADLKMQVLFGNQGQTSAPQKNLGQRNTPSTAQLRAPSSREFLSPISGADVSEGRKSRPSQDLQNMGVRFSPPVSYAMTSPSLSPSRCPSVVHTCGKRSDSRAVEFTAVVDVEPVHAVFCVQASVLSSGRRMDPKFASAGVNLLPMPDKQEICDVSEIPCDAGVLDGCRAVMTIQTSCSSMGVPFEAQQARDFVPFSPSLSQEVRFTPSVGELSGSKMSRPDTADERLMRSPLTIAGGPRAVDSLKEVEPVKQNIVTTSSHPTSPEHYDQQDVPFSVRMKANASIQSSQETFSGAGRATSFEARTAMELTLGHTSSIALQDESAVNQLCDKPDVPCGFEMDQVIDLDVGKGFTVTGVVPLAERGGGTFSATAPRPISQLDYAEPFGSGNPCASPQSITTSISTNLEVHVNRETGKIDVTFEVNGTPVPAVCSELNSPGTGQIYSAEWNIKLERNAAFGPVGALNSPSTSPARDGTEDMTNMDFGQNSENSNAVQFL